jgi:hypothetical protein
VPGPIQSPEDIVVANLPAAPAVPSLTPQQQLAAEYELPNSDFDPDDFKPKGAVPPVAALPAAAPAAPPEPSAPAKPQHSKRVLRMAEQFGIPQAEIDATEPEALDEALVLLQRQMLDDRQRLIAQPGRVQTNEPAPTETPPATPAKPAGFDLGMTPEEEADLHPGIARMFKTLAAKITELESLKGTVGTIQQREQRREHESFQQRCDAAFAKHEAILGKGSYAELNPNGPELRRRQAVLDTAQRDNPKLPFEARVQRAVEALFGAQPVASPAPAAPVQQPTSEQLLTRDAQGRITGRISPEQWNAAATARPSHRETPAKPPGKERATEFVAEQLKTRDFFAQEGPNGAPAVSDEETLPD